MDKNILVVDFGCGDLDELDGILRDHSMSPFFASTKEEVSYCWSKVAVDVVLISVDEEPERYLEIVHLLRQDSSHQAPILFFGTGHPQASVRSSSEALAQGGDYFFKIPCDFKYLAGRARAWADRGSKQPTKTEEAPGEVSKQVPDLDGFFETKRVPDLPALERLRASQTETKTTTPGSLSALVDFSVFSEDLDDPLEDLRIDECIVSPDSSELNLTPAEAFAPPAIAYQPNERLAADLTVEKPSILKPLKSDSSTAFHPLPSNQTPAETTPSPQNTSPSLPESLIKVVFPSVNPEEFQITSGTREHQEGRISEEAFLALRHLLTGTDKSPSSLESDPPAPPARLAAPQPPEPCEEGEIFDEPTQFIDHPYSSTTQLRRYDEDEDEDTQELTLRPDQSPDTAQKPSSAPKPHHHLESQSQSDEEQALKLHTLTDHHESEDPQVDIKDGKGDIIAPSKSFDIVPTEAAAHKNNSRVVPTEAAAHKNNSRVVLTEAAAHKNNSRVVLTEAAASFDVNQEETACAHESPDVAQESIAKPPITNPEATQRHTVPPTSPQWIVEPENNHSKSNSTNYRNSQDSFETLLFSSDEVENPEDLRSALQEPNDEAPQIEDQDTSDSDFVLEFVDDPVAVADTAINPLPPLNMAEDLILEETKTSRQKTSETPWPEAPTHAALGILRPSKLSPNHGKATSISDVLKLLLRTRAQRATGVLRFSHSTGILVAHGEPGALVGSAVMPGFIRLIADLSRISESQARDLALSPFRSPRSLAQKLSIRNILRDDEALRLPARHLEDGLIRFLQQRGSWRFEPTNGNLGAEDLVPRHRELREWLVELLPRSTPEPELSEALDLGPDTIRIVPGTEHFVPSMDAPILELLDGRRRLDEAARLSGIPLSRAFSWALVWLHEGLAERQKPHANSKPQPKKVQPQPKISDLPQVIRPSRSLPLPRAFRVTPNKRRLRETEVAIAPKETVTLSPSIEPNRPESIQKPPVLPPSQPQAASAEQTTDLTVEPKPALEALDQHERVQVLAERVRTQDYFGILGIDSSASRRTIDEAHQRVRSLIPEQVDRELEAMVREVLRSVDEARDILIIPELRAAYEHHLEPRAE